VRGQIFGYEEMSMEYKYSYPSTDKYRMNKMRIEEDIWERRRIELKKEGLNWDEERRGRG
jgi:hypothetical protein